MTQRATWPVLSLCAVASFGQGCDREEEKDVTQAPAGDLAAGLVSLVAASAIASARCERELRCGHVGVDEKYSSLADCETNVRLEWRQDLNRFECPGGIVEQELEECLAAVRDEDCARPFESLKRIVQCRASEICKQGPRP